MRSTLVAIGACWLLVAAGIGSAEAWGPMGHQVVAAIAWDNLSEQTRKKVVALMQQAPPEAGLASLFPQDTRPLDVREREFFIVASTWPDIVRSLQPPERHAFHHPTWHYR